MGHEITRHEYHLGQELNHLPTGKKVTVFGRERKAPGLDSPVIYYWVFDGENRFKSNPQQLKP